MKQCLHPSVYIQDELRARRWSWRELAEKMEGDFAENKLALDLYRMQSPDIRIGEDVARDLGLIFDVDPAFFLNLEELWRNDK